MTTKSLRVYDDLKRRILNGELKAGVRVQVRDLAREYGVSPTPVREALRMLEADGLVVIRPNASVEVASMSVREIEEVYFMRGHLEALATEMATPHLSDKDFAELVRLDEQMNAAAEQRDGARYAALNKEFHNVIYAASPNKLLTKTIAQLWDGGTKFQVVFHFAPHHISRSSAEHRQLIALLRAGNAAGAAELTRKHKLAAGQALIDFLTVTEI